MSKIVKATIWMGVGLFILLVGVFIIFKGIPYFESYGNSTVIETQYFTITGIGMSVIIGMVGTIVSTIGWVILSEGVRRRLRK